MPAVLLAAALAAGMAERRFAAADFDTVASAGPDTVFIVPGRSFAITARGDPEVLDKLDIRVEHGVLRIGRKAILHFWTRSSGGPLRIVVGLPNVRKVALAGGGTMAVSRPRNPRFIAALAGSGTITLVGMDVGDARFAIAGTGTIVASGRAAGLATYAIAGDGTVRATGFRSRDASIRIAGKGDVRTGATGHVSGKIAGYGTVRVRGTVDCTVRKAGGGDMLCRP